MMKIDKAGDEQTARIEELQKLGYNIVTCGECGTVLIEKKENNTVCVSCGRESEYGDSDNPDLYYQGWQV